MVLFRKFGATLRRVGLKIAGGVQNVGRKVSDVLMRAAPVVSGFAPELAGGLAAVGGIARGVSSVAGLAEGALCGGVTADSVKSAVGQVADVSRDVRRQAQAVRQAYTGSRARLTSELERMRA